MKPARELRDPVCGMSVSDITGIKLEHEGKIYYFCGEGCREKFLVAADAKAAGKPRNP